jgi:hypothetical protein
MPRQRNRLPEQCIRDAGNARDGSFSNLSDSECSKFLNGNTFGKWEALPLSISLAVALGLPGSGMNKNRSFRLTFANPDLHFQPATAQSTQSTTE